MPRVVRLTALLTALALAFLVLLTLSRTPDIRLSWELNPAEHSAAVGARRANATLVMLARNNDVNGAARSVRALEDRFNRAHGYPWVFLNDEPFNDDFKRRIHNLVSSPVEFGVVPRAHWVQPDWIDEDRARATREQMRDDDVIYGGSVSYRNMCRFNSGFFFRHPLLEKYRYYWRVEPDVRFHCDVQSDPFAFMADNNKTYGFIIAMYEYERTIETLWDAVREFITLYPEHLASDNALPFLSTDGGRTYTLCHFWSNFEIGDMDLWRGAAYTAFFEFLDRKGGFYYERWGDAPVHSIAAALFSRREQLHFFHEIGYEHAPYTHCPTDEYIWERGRCTCRPQHSFDHHSHSCLKRWQDVADR